MKGYSTFSKLQNWNLTIKWFRVIPSTFVSGRGSYPFAKVQSVYSIDSADMIQLYSIKKKKKKTPDLLFIAEGLDEYTHNLDYITYEAFALSIRRPKLHTNSIEERSLSL